jgi:hypothetical protein
MMKYLNKTKLVAAVGSAALAATLCAPANAAVVLGGADGWEVSYGGFVNLFYTQSDWEFDAGGSEDSAHLNEGLLPAFHTLTVKTPEINGLKGTGQITFAPDSSGTKGKNLNKGGAEIDMREVFFNVEGDFGTISAGRTLALYQRQAILKDYTLFGVGASAGADTGGTSLGRIGFGYVYPDFRTRFTYKTPNVNGFVLEVGIFDPDETAPGGLFGAGNTQETDTPQFQAEATYNTTFEGGSFNVWASFIWQEMEVAASSVAAVAATTGAGTNDPATNIVTVTSNASAGSAASAVAGGDIEMFGYNIGVDVNMGGFNFMGSYYDGEAIGTIFLQDLGAFGCSATACGEADNDGYIIQGAYTFNGTTKVGISYGESTQDANAALGIAGYENELWSVGVYHDVNSWLKVVAEYNQQDSNFPGLEHEADSFSIGGFILW